MKSVLLIGALSCQFGTYCAGADASISTGSRNLAIELVGYQPITDVSDEAAIDRDQSEMERQLALATLETYANAQNIYEKGAFSVPVAEILLDEELPEAVAERTLGSGTSADLSPVSGYTAENYEAGATKIRIAYETPTNCSVGGNPDPETSGCLADSGVLNLGDFALSYSYNKTTDNLNGLTIQGFSTNAKENFYSCDACPYIDYSKFVDYFGEFEYADKWVSAAFEGGNTEFDRGNADFSLYTSVGRSACIKKGTVFMNIWMQVIGEMEAALDKCADDADSASAWDRAVAYYVGSLEGANLERSGNLLYELANKRCSNYATCGEDGGEIAGLAKANFEIIDLFNEGQAQLEDGLCDEVRLKKERIVQLMTVPLIQGALRYNYIINFKNHGEKIEAEGAAFAAAVLPIIHSCNQDDAATIYENTKVGSEDENFVMVKAAFENNYACIGITCEDIGGLYDADIGDYLAGFEPCGISGSATMAVSIAVSLTLTAVSALQFIL